MTCPVAFITGCTGQDGSILADLLLTKGYHVHGLVRRCSSPNLGRIAHIQHSMHLHVGDVTDGACLQALIAKIKPTEIYNMAAQSFVGSSFEMPVYTAQATGMGVLNVLEAVRACGLADSCRILQASSSEMFGKVQQVPQSETTPFWPRSMYGVAKLFGHYAVLNYRETYGMFAVSSITFNHESPTRGEEFVTRKITRAVAAILHGQQDCLMLGNLDARRDWMSAHEAVVAMWMMLQHHQPDDYVLATGVTTTVRRFVELAFQAAGCHISWKGKGLDEQGSIISGPKTGQCVVRIDSALYRPCEVDLLVGDASKAKRVLGWQPTTTVNQLAQQMVTNDLRTYEKQS